MSVTLTNLTAEVQLRCDALTNFSLIATVIDCAIAAKKVEMAGGTITRTILDAQIQRFVTASGGGSVIEDLLALAASVEVRTSATKKLKVQKFLTTGSWTRPTGVDTVEVLLVGGGGGSGALSDNRGQPGTGNYMYATGSGGGGKVTRQILDVTATTVGNTVAVVIGSGGSAGATGSSGGVGGTSSFGSYLTALGGGGGSGLLNGAAQNGTAGATTGGHSTNSTMSSGNSAVIFPGFGAGAGGNATLGIVEGRNISGNYTTGTFYQTRPSTAASYNLVGVGSTPFVAASNATGVYDTLQIPAPGISLYGYGAGGGCNQYHSVFGLDGAGGGSNYNAAANSGGGGGGIATTGWNTVNAGGAGGSGYCLVSWWE